VASTPALPRAARRLRLEIERGELRCMMIPLAPGAGAERALAAQGKMPRIETIMAASPVVAHR
jgi:hypothetical protein